MGVVLDSSVAAAWVLPDERSAFAERAIEVAFRESAHVPTIWVYEVQNVLAFATRRKRLTLEDAREACRTLISIPAQIHAPEGIGREFALAMPSRVTAYDAAYLCVARDLHMPLATLDESLREAAHALGVDVFGE